MLRPKDEGVVLEQAEFQGLARMGKWPWASPKWTKTPISGRMMRRGLHFSRMGNPGLHEMEVGLVAEGPQGGELTGLFSPGLETRWS